MMRRTLGWGLWLALWPVVWVFSALDDLALRMDEDDPWDVLSD